MPRLTWLFWILVAAVVAVPACLMMRSMHGNARLSLGDILEFGIVTLVSSIPALIGIIAGVKSFRRESKESPCSVSMRLVSAGGALANAVLLGMLAGAVLGYIILSWPSQPSSEMFEIAYNNGPFGAVIGLFFGLFTSSISALLFGTGVGQRPSAQNEL